jgi:hypothetical protein
MSGSLLHTVVHYDGTDYGRIYLGDIGRRRQLGGAKEGINTLGQDRYIRKGQDATFIQTGEIMMSAADSTVSGSDSSLHGTTNSPYLYNYKPGIIRNWINKGAFHVDFGV